MLLQAKSISRHYGSVVAVDGVDFTVEHGSIAALIGPNGAGKTTALNIISGQVEPTGGAVVFDGETITGFRPDQICQRGMGRTFQSPQVFSSMSVGDNVLVSSIANKPVRLLETLFHSGAAIAGDKLLRERMREMLQVVGLSISPDRPLDGLPFGILRLVELARALMSQPKIILMDEPASGLSRAEMHVLRDIFLKIKSLGTAILMVEHNMPLVMSTADKIVVLDRGRWLATGTPVEIRDDVSVRRAYLGTAN